MPAEEFTLRITKKGEVWADLRGLGEEQVRELRRMLEEIIGPIVEEVPVGEEGPGPAVRFVTDDGEQHYRLRSR